MCVYWRVLPADAAVCRLQLRNRKHVFLSVSFVVQIIKLRAMITLYMFGSFRWFSVAVSTVR
jgi:hypothetical protein